ncbi:MAG TPA: aminotransferase class I/II-fold pyridoxal phosphate-dependent enzyme [Chroococcales cyanobacterium]
MRFSDIADVFTGTTNELYLLKNRLSEAGEEITDLISANVNDQGIFYPQDRLREIIQTAQEQARIYNPHPLGQSCAREAIVNLDAGIYVPPEQVVLTPGTSISYFYCFKLLAESHDEILCPTPSYPLFEYIARLCDVRLVT